MFKYSTIIGRKLISYLLAFSFVTTLAAFAFILKTDYERGLDAFSKNLEQIHSSYQQSISYSLWNFDYRQIEAQLLGIMNFPGVVYVYIESKDTALPTAGNVYAHTDQRYSFPLEYVSAGQKYNLGTLHISVDHSGLRNEIRDKAINILVTQFFKTFSVSLFVMFIVHQLITRRLGVMADWANRFSLRSLNTDLNIKQHHGKNDEFNLVADAINNMRNRLIQDLHEQENSRREIESIKERLSIAINNAAIGFCTYNTNTDSWSGNSHFASQLGTTEYELENLPHPIEAMLNRLCGPDAPQQRERINQMLLGRLNKIHDSFHVRNFRNEDCYLEVTLQVTRYKETRPAQILICVVNRTREEEALAKARELAVSLENKVTQRTEELYNEQARSKAAIRVLEQELEQIRTMELNRDQQNINLLLHRQLQKLPAVDAENQATLNAFSEYLRITSNEATSSINLAATVKQWVDDALPTKINITTHLPFSLIIEENPELIHFLFACLILQDPAVQHAYALDVQLKLEGDQVDFSAVYELDDNSGIATDENRDDVFRLCSHILNNRFGGKVSRELLQDNRLQVRFNLAMVHL